MTALRRDCIWKYDLPACHRAAAGGGASEYGERQLARLFVPGCQNVLELGGGSGSVSGAIQEALRKGGRQANHVVVQPREDASAMGGGASALVANRDACGDEYTVVDHYLQPGASFEFDGGGGVDCAVVDCEGCLDGEFEKNPSLFAALEQLQIERDDVPRRGAIDRLLSEVLGMDLVFSHDDGGCCATEVWARGASLERARGRAAYVQQYCGFLNARPFLSPRSTRAQPALSPQPPTASPKMREFLFEGPRSDASSPPRLSLLLPLLRSISWPALAQRANCERRSTPSAGGLPGTRYGPVSILHRPQASGDIV